MDHARLGARQLVDRSAPTHDDVLGRPRPDAAHLLQFFHGLRVRQRTKACSVELTIQCRERHRVQARELLPRYAGEALEREEPLRRR